MQSKWKQLRLWGLRQHTSKTMVMRGQTTYQRQLPSEAIAACDVLCTTHLVQEDAS